MGMPTQRDEEFIGECRFCGSENLEYDSIEPDDTQLFQDVRCIACEKKFTIYSATEWYLTDLDADIDAEYNRVDKLKSEIEKSYDDYSKGIAELLELDEMEGEKLLAYLNEKGGV